MQVMEHDYQNGYKGHDPDALEAERDYLLHLRQGDMSVPCPSGPHQALLEELRDALTPLVAVPFEDEWLKRTFYGWKQAPKYASLKRIWPIEPGEDAQPETMTEEALSSWMPLPRHGWLAETMEQGASPWLDAHIAFSREWSPRAYDDFHEGVGIFLLSTIAARRIALPHGGKRYTPLFLALCARTSLYSKSTTADIGISILSECGLDWLLAPDESTPQKFIQSMAGRVPADYGSLDYERQERIKRQLALSGQRGWFYEEFGQHLSAMARENGAMADFKGILRRLDDCKDKYTRETIARGNETVYNPYVALLTGMTPADIRPYAKAGGALWHDGFWARFAFITPPNDDPKLDRFPRGNRQIPASLTKPLRSWHERLGMPSVTITLDEAGKYSYTRNDSLPEQVASWSDDAYEAYYRYDVALKMLLKTPVYKHGDFDGNYTRFPEKALRVAMLLASLENNGRIEMRHWARAQSIAERWRKSLHHLYDQLNRADATVSEQMEEKIIQVISRRGGATAREISQYIGGLDTATARLKADELERAGVLEKSTVGRTEKYVVIKESVEV